MKQFTFELEKVTGGNFETREVFYDRAQISVVADNECAARRIVDSILNDSPHVRIHLLH